MGKKWEKDTKARFFTFPVELLRGAFTNTREFCKQAVHYAIFVRCNEYNESPKEAFEFFGIHGNHDAAIKEGRELYESICNPPLTSVNDGIIWDFYRNPKTDFEIAVFCTFCGLRSIIGTKPFVKTNNGLLIARMFGCRSVVELEALKEKPAYYREHFSTAQKVRYQLTEKIIKNELVLNWGLKYYSNQSKGFHVSFKIEFESLVLHAEKSRKSNLLKKQQQEQKQVVKRIRQQIRGK